MNHKLEQVYHQIPKALCPANCGRCCGILYPSLAELTNIKQWCHQHNIAYKDFNITLDLDCPYLGIDKQCTIYSVRPYLCRIMGVSTELSCPINICKPTKILNKTQSDWCYKHIYLHGKERQRTLKHRKELKELLNNIQSIIP
jgi:Fe-S-cluster containining protein